MPDRRPAALAALAIGLLATLPPADAAFPPKLAAPPAVAALAAELDLPPTRPGEIALKLDEQPFAAAALAKYGADVPLPDVTANPEKYPLRLAVLATFGTIREGWTPPPAGKVISKGKKDKEKMAKRPTRSLFLTAVPSPVTEPFKKDVSAAQTFPAVTIAKLELAGEELARLAAVRGREPKRWQAHYDYAAAVALARQAFLHEYDLALGSVLRLDLPDLDPKKGHDGWRLVSTEKMHSKKDVRKLWEDAQEAFGQVEKVHRGTPWAAAARRERVALPGLKWEPAALK